MIEKNIAANYIGTAVMVATPVLALPFYISLLGPKQFGLISFVTTMQALLGLVESGVGQVALREFSMKMNGTSEGCRNAAVLLFGFERIYWSLSTTIGLVILLLGGYISSHWLVLDASTAALGKEAVCWGAVIFAVQFPGSLYRSLLAASQEQVVLNMILIGGLLLRHIGGLILLMYWPKLSTYLIWQAAAAASETFVRSRVAWRTVGAKRGHVRWESTTLRPVLAAVAKLSGVVLLGSLTAQLDRIILSRLVPIEQFGYYVIASTVALGVINMVTPLVQALSPRIMQSFDKPRELFLINIRLTKMIAVVGSIGLCSYLVGGSWFLNLWLRNLHTAATVHPLLSVLLAGSALNAFYHVGYFNWLARRNTRRILVVNSVSIVLCLLLTPIFIHRLGMIGATLGFVAMNAFGFVLSLDWISRGRAASGIMVAS